MNPYTALLLQGAKEVREYKHTPNAELFGAEWLDGLADDMERASALSDQQAVELAIDTLAYRLIDSGPMGAFPSFGKALDALQRRQKKKHV